MIRLACILPWLMTSCVIADLYAVGVSDFFVAKYYRVSTEDASIELISENPDDIFMTMMALGPDRHYYTIDAGPYLRRADPLTGESDMLYCVCAQQWPTALAVGDDGIAIIPMIVSWTGNYMYRYDVNEDVMLGTVSFNDPERELFALTYRADGVLLGTNGLTVYEVDPLSGDTSVIGELDASFHSVRSVARETTTGLVYLIANEANANVLYRVDLDTFETELIGPLSEEAKIWGIAGIACPADFNADGELTILDFVAFQQAWQSQDPAADVNGDGAFDILDFVAFQVIFQEGCR